MGPSGRKDCIGDECDGVEDRFTGSLPERDPKEIPKWKSDPIEKVPE
jgi:hypothetical protein